jgi:predicted nucleic acid-binding protein
VAQSSFDLALALGTAFYDACYLEVARLQNVPLITADEAFYRQAGRRAEVVWLGDYQQRAM